MLRQSSTEVWNSNYWDLYREVQDLGDSKTFVVLNEEGKYDTGTQSLKTRKAGSLDFPPIIALT